MCKYTHTNHSRFIPEGEECIKRVYRDISIYAKYKNIIIKFRDRSLAISSPTELNLF
jgi:hypothetical protein